MPGLPLNLNPGDNPRLAVNGRLVVALLERSQALVRNCLSARIDIK